MDGIHDLGGRHGFGGSFEERDEEPFHEDWEKRVFALSAVLFGHRCFNTDEFRHAIERLDPLAYLSDGYWGRWLGAFELLVGESRRRAGSRIRPPSARWSASHVLRSATRW